MTDNNNESSINDKKSFSNNKKEIIIDNPLGDQLNVLGRVTKKLGISSLQILITILIILILIIYIVITPDYAIGVSKATT
jgi:hypothetical protein